MGSGENMETLLRQGVRLVVDKSWDGAIVAGLEETQVRFRLSPQGLEVEVSAPFYNDPAPSAPGGELDGLWEYEVVELFLLGGGGHYLEVELGPHCHYLILLLAGIRQVKTRLTPCHCKTRIIGSRWQASLVVAKEQLPLPFSHANAYVIHGQGAGRRYLAAFPVPGAPRVLLFPLSGHPHGFQAAMSFFRLLAPEVHHLHLLRVMAVNSFWFQYMSVTKARALRLEGMNYVNDTLAEIRQ